MSTIFDFVADEIERQTELEKLEARGTVRLALKSAGFDAGGITTLDLELARAMNELAEATGTHAGPSSG